MPVNSREKGKRGELQWAKALTSFGWPSERGQQRAGGPDSPDVKGALDGVIYWEVKRQHNRALNTWHDKAVSEAPAGAVAVVVHRRNHQPWTCTLGLLDLARVLAFVAEDDNPIAHGLYNGPEDVVLGTLQSSRILRDQLHVLMNTKHQLHLETQLDIVEEAAPPTKFPVLVHKRPVDDIVWLASMRADTFFDLLEPYALLKGAPRQKEGHP